VGFTNREPGVSALCLAAAPESLKRNDQTSYLTRPTTKTLIAGNILGELKQWELIPVRNGEGLEYWPRMTSQRLPGKAHVFNTNDPLPDDTLSPAIRQLLMIQQQVILAATDHDLKFWDPTTGNSLYGMQGLDFSTGSLVRRPSLVSVNNSVLVTNGMDQYICVHDFAIERVTSENAQDMIDHEKSDDQEGS
jgi:hypothetical protein